MRAQLLRGFLAVLVFLGVAVATVGTFHASMPPASARGGTGAPESERAATDASGAVEPTEHRVVVRYFYGDGCPYCAQQAEVMDGWEAQLPVDIHRVEVWDDAEGRQRYQDLAAAYGVEARAVPATFIGPWVWLGFNEELGQEMVAAIDACARSGCDDPLLRIDAPEPSESSDADTPAQAEARDADDPAAGTTTLEVPLVGTIELAGTGLVASTLLISFVDGFNPCSLWVLSILLALLVRTGSRARLAAVGGTFLAVTALVYGLFIAGAFGTLAYVGHLGWIRGVVAAFALVFAVVSIKDYVALKQGPSFTIPDRAKPGIYRRSRNIADLDTSLPAVLLATVVMALGVALVELPCTAGFPVVWSQIVHDAGVGGAGFAGLLGLYLGVYLLDELVIVGIVVATLRVSKVQERHVSLLKLVGGTIMLALGATLLVAPDLLHDIGGTLVVFGVAVAVAAVVHGARTLATR